MFVAREILMVNGQRSDSFMLSPAAAAVGKLRVAMLFLLILRRNGQVQINAVVIWGL
jgi:hypothetical protein